MGDYLSHLDRRSGRKEKLYDHLRLVANRAEEYASAFEASEEAYLAGMLHDLGKYGALFQKRLKGEVSGIDHWSLGAWTALQNYRYIAAALSIQGHHIGLQASNKHSLLNMNPKKLLVQHPLGLMLSEADTSNLLRLLENDSLLLPSFNNSSKSLYPTITQTAAGMLDVRMLFSALVDADYIETEALFQMDEYGNRQYRENGLALEPDRVLNWLRAYVSNLASNSSVSFSVQKMRSELFNACLQAATRPQGLFTLTAPTGSGKTLSMLAFALAHAVKYNLRRIVIVVPYLNIIEQTVKVYHQFLRQHMTSDELEKYILEHHSLSGIHPHDNLLIGDDNYEKPLLTENWDAPIVITTNVQLLESLFSNRPSACRKLHRLASSVILFDEVQTLPVSLAIPTLATLSHLAERYQSTIVFATATQPAFSHLHEFVSKHCAQGWQPQEIFSEKGDLFDLSKRVNVNWPDGTITWEKLAAKLMTYRQVMCVVNIKRHAKSLFEILAKNDDQGIFHISTNMCPAHRLEVLEKVRKLLDSGKTCRLISTQCVEAGVDIDFPVVYRALGPLDAIAQAAGRCNRNGRLVSGEVHVFKPQAEAGRLPYPDLAYAQATDVTSMLLQQLRPDGIDISDPSIFTRYFCQLYSIKGIGTEDNFNEPLYNAIARQDFEEVAQQYRII
ncbi:MAG: CRISPR-associated helicase Cas3', partial [Dehalococcoidales bacterium]|nr:CRISPR-associated helicase Cas3' [Dehalococcoidales bacterium]